MIRSLQHSLTAALVAMLAVGASAAPSGAQASVREGTIDPGMTRAQVEERLGPPKVVRTSGASTYLFYANGCARSCGMDDLVVLEQDAVTDAVFRASAHHYTGQSSSPNAVAPRAARSSRARTPRGVTPIRSDSAMSAAGRGGLVIGGAPAGTDSAAPHPAATRRGVARRAARPARARAATTAAPASAASVTTQAPPAAPAAPAAPADDVTNARNGQRSTTGPVDARAAVKNPGSRLYPAATPVRTPSRAADSSGARVPYQGAQLAPSDSDMRALRRAVTIPGQTTPPAGSRPDSTKP